MRPLDDTPVHAGLRCGLLFAVENEARGQLHSIKPNMEIPEKERTVDNPIPSVIGNLQPQPARQTISLEIDRAEYQRRLDAVCAVDLAIEAIRGGFENWKLRHAAEVVEIDAEANRLRLRLGKLNHMVARVMAMRKACRTRLKKATSQKAYVRRKKFRGEMDRRIAARKRAIARVLKSAMEVEAVKAFKRQMREITITKKKPPTTTV